MKIIIQPLKGTRDFYPQLMRRRNWLYGHIREVSESFGYEEYEGPYLEKITLYAAKSGDELVKEQAFVFPDRGGDMITLRPELTPTLARMIAQKQNELIFPLKWWSFGPFWRYERPQKGRTREFFQWNIDLLGVNSPIADAEIIAIAAEFFRMAGLTPEKVKLKVNNRKLMDAEIQRIGFSVDQKAMVLKLIDRKDKLSPDAWEKYVLEKEVTPSQLEELKSLLADKELWKKSPELSELFPVLEQMGVEGYVEYDPQVIRGLDYYTGMVFEARDATGENRAILGGGHYDNLVADVGGMPVPGVGFAMGDVVMSLLLEEQNLFPKQTAYSASVFITIFDTGSVGKSIALDTGLRKSGLKTYLYPEQAKLDKQLKFADRSGFRFVLILGPEEDAKGQVMLKDLKNHTQEAVDKKELPSRIRSLLEKK
jgi:histidyl-tRNA synthetase